MNRHELVFGGIRIAGVVFLASAVMGLPTFLQRLFAGNVGFWDFVRLAVELGVGWMLAMRTPKVCALLGEPKGGETA